MLASFSKVRLHAESQQAQLQYTTFPRPVCVSTVKYTTTSKLLCFAELGGTLVCRRSMQHPEQYCPMSTCCAQLQAHYCTLCTMKCNITHTATPGTGLCTLRGVAVVTAGAAKRAAATSEAAAGWVLWRSLTGGLPRLLCFELMFAVPKMQSC